MPKKKIKLCFERTVTNKLKTRVTHIIHDQIRRRKEVRPLYKKAEKYYNKQAMLNLNLNTFQWKLISNKHSN